MSIKPCDYYSNFINEGERLYSVLRSIEKTTFNNWVSMSFSLIKTIDSYNDVAPNRNLIDEIVKKGYTHLESQCHYTAKAICLIDKQYEYWTGFIIRKDFISFVSHSFNMVENQIIDFARIDNDFNIFGDDNSLPHIYYGIHIPKWFIEEFRDDILNNHSMNPHLIEWYKHCML